MAVKLELNQVIWLEEIDMYSFHRRSLSWNLSQEEKWDRELIKGEVIKIDDNYYYIMIKKWSSNTIIELDIDSPASNDDYRLWLNKEDYIKMKSKQEEISDLKSKASRIIDKFTEFELIDFIKSHN